jgi:hypothetical protein
MDECIFCAETVLKENILALTGLQFQREGVPYAFFTFTFK